MPLFNKSFGFSLIELTSSLVLVGTLSAAAIPHFLALQSHANETAIIALANTLDSSHRVAYVQSTLDGRAEHAQHIIHAEGKSVVVEYGHITTQWHRGFGPLLASGKIPVPIIFV